MPEPQAPTNAQFEQPSLFLPFDAVAPTSGAPGLLALPALDANSPLGACALPYAEHLRRGDASAYTIACFLSDLRLLTEYVGRETPLARISTAQLHEWITYLRLERGRRPAPKTLARRVTFLKNFFGWLAAERILPEDRAARLVLTRPAPPLPELLYEDEVQRLEVAAAEDPRCAVLVMLVLYAGLKREEVMGLALRHVDLSDPEHPAVEVHFPAQAKRRRERRMEMPAAWAPLVERYVARYSPREYLFECTERNLTYVLAAAARRARLQKRVTLQLLRDIYAVRQLRAGVAMDVLRERLGLSEEAWFETAVKYRKLAFPA